MTTVTALDKIDDEAAGWLVAMDEGRFEEDMAAQFDAWLATSDDHVRAWERATQAWASVDESDPLIQAMRVDALVARPARFSPIVRAGAAIAAASIVALGLFGWQVGQRSTPAGQLVMVAQNAAPTFFADTDARLSTTLPDGTRALLDGHSAITLAYTPRRRDLRLLRGQATFDVQHDQSRPFAVQASNAVVTATGTRFTVRTLPTGMITTLDQGTVRVSRGGEERTVTLNPGEQAIASAGAPLMVLPGTSSAAVARQSGYLEFDGVPLEKAVAQVNAFGGTIRVTLAPDVSGLRISGRFRLGDVDGFVDAVTQILPLRRHREAHGVIRLSRR